VLQTGKTFRCSSPFRKPEMNNIRYTLLSDGSSDRALIPILTWLLHFRLGNQAINAEYADLRRLPRPPKILSDRIVKAVELFPCDILFVHRDAENQPAALRRREIEDAISTALTLIQLPHTFCVIPIRMGEAWLLIDETAIRKASGNPISRAPLILPSISRLESLPDPKNTLYGLIQKASGLRGRRLRNLRVNKCVHRLAELIDDFTPLRQLSAFSSLEFDLERQIAAN